MSMVVTTVKAAGTLPAGDYYVGDPCYALHDDDWDGFLQALDRAQEKAVGAVFEYKGHWCFVSATNCGDGCYQDQDGRNYPVDAGMIAAIPAVLCDSGRSIRFSHPFECGSDPGHWIEVKRIKIGHIIIET